MDEQNPEGESNQVPTSKVDQKINKVWVIGAIGFVVVVILGFYLISGRTNQDTGTSQQVDQEQLFQSATREAAPDNESTPGGVQSEGEVRTVNVKAGAFYFDPNEIRAKKGEKIKMVITAVDMMHNFNIDELGVKSATVKSGETTTIEFVVDQVGEFEYYCAVGQHRQNGQVGKLIVE